MRFMRYIWDFYAYFGITGFIWDLRGYFGYVRGFTGFICLEFIYRFISDLWDLFWMIGSISDLLDLFRIYAQKLYGIFSVIYSTPCLTPVTNYKSRWQNMEPNNFSSIIPSNFDIYPAEKWEKHNNYPRKRKFKECRA